MVKAIVVKRERVSMEKNGETNQYRNKIPPASPDQLVSEHKAKGQADANGDDLNRRGERGNKMNGATEYGDAADPENARVPNI